MTTLITDTLAIENITATTADFTMGGAVRLAIREGFIDLKTSASPTAPATAIATREDLAVAGGYMFQRVEHNGPVETIPQGCILANGQKVYDSSFPVQIAKVRSGHQFAVSELLWQQGTTGNPDAYKGCWSLGGTDEYGAWVRPPKLNRDGTYRAPFLRGSEIGVDAGKIVSDAMRNLTGNLYGYTEASYNARSFGTATGVFKTIRAGSDNSAPPSQAGSVNGSGVSFDASNALPAGTTTDPVTGEFRPRYHGVIMCIRMFGVVSNPGSLDAAQLATDLSIANVKIDALMQRPVIKAGQVDVTASRQPAVTYTSTSPDWLLVTITGYATSSNQAIDMTVGQRRHIAISVSAGNLMTVNALVPPNGTWQYTSTGFTSVKIIEGA